MEDFYTVDPADAPRFAELAAQAVDEGFTAFKCMAVAADDAHRRPAAGALSRSLRRARCAKPWATRSTSWSIATPGIRRGWV